MRKKMFRGRKYFIEALWEGLLKISGSVTSIIIILIVLFLFSEGLGLFKKDVIEEGYVLAVNKDNPIKDLNSQQIKDVFDVKIESWKELGVDVKDDKIILLRLDDIPNYVPEEEIAEDMSNLDTIINNIIEANPGMIAFVPRDFTQKGFNAKILDLGTINLKEFVTGKEWFPTAHPAAQFGVMPIVLGTLWVSLGAILFALPFGLAVAIYSAELANKRVHKILKPVIELLAGIPSVVYGFFGLIVIVPLIQKAFNLDVGETGLAGSIVLAIMALPTIITIAEDALRSTPRAMKEASLALGANKWQTILKVTIPYSISGITAGVVLGIGRAIGETMAVLMVTGNAAVIPHTLLEPVRTIPATIAAELGEAPKGGAHYEALFILGCILFIITLIINLVVEYISYKNKNKVA
ncbi:MAG: phosphate ABC transporter permease subunit PstC [Bacteroidales bacterium]|jgi:phosphate transport system permease protein|nr:phosphate ABC transporter permease subunit PstC [Bacteroidales bacterium]MDX9797552.1 phosphate ABC transporter permease subunit PstC [Bacteroidales bacterium]